MGKRKRASCVGLARKMARLGNLLDVVATGEGQSQQEADQDIRKLEGVKTYPIHLAELLLNPKRSVDVRLLASEKLKMSVVAHWSSTAKGFLPPEVDSRNKEKIKTLLLKGLRESPKEVQKAVADVIAAIIPWDWPHNWEGLIGTLLSYLHEGEESDSHGGLLVLKRINFIPSHPHWSNNLVVISSEMNRILAGESQYSAEIRCMALEVFSHVVTSLSHCDHHELFQHRLRPAVSLFCKTSMTSWKSENSDDKLKTNILKVIVMLIKHSPKYIGDYLANMLPLFWQTFTDSAQKYQANIVNRKGLCDERIDSVCTKPNEADNSLVDLIRAMLEFLRHFAGGQEMYRLAYPGYELADYEWINLQGSYVPTQALHGLITLMQVTDDQVKLWNTDIEDLVRKEFWIFPNDGIRRGTEDLIELVMKKKRTMASGLFKVITEYIEGRLTEIAKQIVGQSMVGQNGWKFHESLLLAFGLINEYIIPEKAGESLLFDDASVFEYVILADLNNPESHPLLVGHCLCLGGTYGDLIPPDLASAFLKATVIRLRQSQPACVRICAAKAAYLWYSHVSLEQHNRNDKIRRSHIRAVFEGLFSVAEDFGSARVVKLVLKGVAALMPINETFTASVADRIYSLVETALPEYGKMSANEHPCLNVLRNMSMNRKCVQLLEEHLIPTLLDMMTSIPLERPNTGKVVVEITEALVKQPSAPLTSPLINTLLPAFCDFLMRTDNSSSLSRVLRVLQAFLRDPLRRVIMQRDKDGRYTAQHIPQVIILALKQKRQVRKACGVLISLMEGGWPETGECMEELLNALLSCMRDRKSENDDHKVLEVYAHLIHRQPNTVLNFLASAPSPGEEKSTLEFVISEGLCRGSCSFLGKEERTLKLAFGKILEYALSNLSSQLHKITVKDNFERTMGPLLVEIWDKATRNY